MTTDTGGTDADTNTVPRRPLWPVVLVLAAFYVPILTVRIASHDVFWFVHMGRQTLTAANTSTTITPALGWQSELGYDGQYYYALAVDPRHARDYMPPNDQGFVYSRALYPAGARLLALGSVRAVPYTMLLLNLIAVGAGTLALAAWLRRRGLSPLLSLLYGLFPGLVFAVFRDLTEPLAYGLVALAALTLDLRSRKAMLGSAALFALAGLARETTLTFAAAAALGIALLSDRRTSLARRWLAAASYLVVCVAPLFVWRQVVGSYVDAPTQEKGSSLVPFRGIADYWPWDALHIIIVGAVLLPTLVALAGLPRLLRRRRSAALGVLLGLNAAALVIFLPTSVDIDYQAASRAATGIVLAAIACLPSWSRNGRLSGQAGAVALSWSFVWYLAVAAAVGIDGFSMVTS